METEYGITVASVAGAEFSSENLAGELVNLAREKPHLPGAGSSGIFLPNGSRFYVDCGAHPELATPECSNPWDICRYVQAGEQMLLGLAGQLPRLARGVKSVSLLRSNTDYASRSTWGCHESYLHSEMGRNSLSRQIIPHLVSRLVFTGAGGFDCHSSGVIFLISPRVSHLRSAISGDSTGDRGIFHTRDESLCGKGYRRLHILSGESLCGETGIWLKVGSTALVVALIEAGKRPGEAIEFTDALAAMRLFAADPSLQRSVKLGNGREVTALDIQDHYLRQVEKHVGAKFMPPWAPEVCLRWRATLERLRSGGPSALATSLDWAIKYALFQRHLLRRGTTYEKLSAWTHVVEQLIAASSTRSERSISTAVVLGARGTLASARKLLTPYLHERGLVWEGLDAFLSLRLELFEIDTRFSILGDAGIFTSLDRSGVLDHRLQGVDNIPHALENPPALGRAALRGACIRRLADQSGRYGCEWDGVFDRETRKRLDLSDPFCTSEHWELIKDPRELRPRDLDGLFRSGHYSEILSQLSSPAFATPQNIESLSISYARLGRISEALEMLHGQRENLDEFHHLCLTMSIFSNGIVPDVAALAPLIEAGEPLREQSEPGASYSRFIFLLYKGLYLMHTGSFPLAEALFTVLLEDDSNALRTRMYARTKCYMGELQRRLERTDEAMRFVLDASATYEAENLTGDLADQSLPMLAKLTTDDGEACQYFAEAENTQRMHRNKLGLARILCLRARRLQYPDDKEEVELLQRTVPVLSGCPVARRIVREWRSWIAPPAAAGPTDYWGL